MDHCKTCALFLMFCKHRACISELHDSTLVMVAEAYNARQTMLSRCSVQPPAAACFAVPVRCQCTTSGFGCSCADALDVLLVPLSVTCWHTC